MLILLDFYTFQEVEFASMQTSTAWNRFLMVCRSLFTLTPLKSVVEKLLIFIWILVPNISES